MPFSAVVPGAREHARRFSVAKRHRPFIPLFSWRVVRWRADEGWGRDAFAGQSRRLRFTLPDFVTVAMARLRVRMAVETIDMSITLDMDEQDLASLPLQPGERERLMQIELACRFYANGWLSLGRAARMAKLDRFAFGVQLAERNIPRQYSLDDLDADLRYAGGQ